MAIVRRCGEYTEEGILIKFRSTFKLVATLSAIATAALAAPATEPLSINTPVSVVSCGSSVLSYTGGVPPYILFAVKADTPTPELFFIAGPTTDTSATWSPVAYPAGEQAFYQVEDSVGTKAVTATFTVLPGEDESCLED
ncbi:hypothetical protein DFP72DRAFT_1167965 [Ephemerocybe angulata]|uniref:Uncharacterized protein n=1 Tax=Ephemerocybe angulata TaxID=980116 RepID=A0A8H6I532_9AGAR|nr:hypothetical protein DFP72DRAFT_1167965 [Tulosesus angulatus]